MTRGAVLAIKARTLLFAARPLFNSATPYLSGGHDDLVCFGSKSDDRWQDAIEANEAVLTWAAANNYALLNTGGAGEGNPNPKAFEDYATATSTPANREVLLAYKCDETGQWTWPGSASRALVVLPMAETIINRFSSPSTMCRRFLTPSALFTEAPPNL